MNYENRKNRNRGYRALRIWQDAVDLYCLTCRIFKDKPFVLTKVVRQAIGSADSVHRNIAEGYCRRSKKEYLNFLNIALGSLGESVSGYHAYRKEEQIADEEFEQLDILAYRLENGMLKTVDGIKASIASDSESTYSVRESDEIFDA